MYRYAYSVPGEDAATLDWQQANANARLRRIELSNSAKAPYAALQEMIGLTQSGAVEVASIHIPFGIDTEMGFGSKEVRQEHMNFIADFIRRHAPLGSKNYTFHSGPERTPAEIPDRDAAIGLIREGIEQLLPVLEEQGASLNVELLPRKCLGNTPEEVEKLVEGFPVEQVGICLDVNHYNGHPEAVPGLIKRFGTRLKTLHFSDCDGIDEAHWMPPHGCLDWVQIMQNIKEVRHDLLLIMECYTTINLDHWANKRPLASSRIRAMERTAAILESVSAINWNMEF